jgi:DNA-binding CsgD family transcriptional regulator/tetratricopeptide (TPR) repeat protein
MRAVAGREQQAASLGHALDTARGGRLGVALVTGEAGIGKSHLVTALADDAAGAGFRVLAGACLELGSTVAYLPFAEMLRDAVRGLSDQERTALLGPGGEVVEPLLGFGHTASAPATVVAPAPVSRVEASAELARLQLFESLLRMTERMAARAPLLVVLEDIQWADRASLDLSVFLARNLRDAPILLVMTARTGGGGSLPDAAAAFTAGLERSARVERLELGPLEPAATGVMLAGLLGRTPDADLVARIHLRAAGNPLFIEELLAWSEAGGSWAGTTPPRLRDLVAARVAGLPREAHEVLRLASAAGRMVDDELLVEATGLDAPVVRAGIRAAISEGLLVPARVAGHEGYAFRHDLVREAVASELLPGERARLHEAFALALSAGRARAADPAELAYHWDAAGEPTRALQAHVAAGIAARNVFGFEAAEAHFDRAMQLWPLVPAADDLTAFDRIDLVQATAAAAAMAGDHRRAIELERSVVAELGLDSGDPRVVMALERMRRSMWESGDTLGALAEAERAAGIVDSSVSRARASVLAHLAGLYLSTGDLRQARTTAIAALEVAAAAGAREEQALAGGVLGWSLMYAGRVEEALGLIRLGASAADAIGEVRGRALAADHFSRALEMAGRLDEAAAAAMAGTELCRSSGLGRTYGALLAATAARCLLAIGRVEEGVRVAETGLAAGPVGPGHVAVHVAAALGALAQDRITDADAALRGAASGVGNARDRDVRGWMAVGEMGVALRRGDPARAIAAARSLDGAGPVDGGRVTGAGAPLVILGASVGPLLRLGAGALADAAMLRRAMAGHAAPSGQVPGAPPSDAGKPPDAVSSAATDLSADRERLTRLLHYLTRHEELRAAHAPELAVATAELARADDPTSETAVSAWRAALDAEAAATSRRPALRAYACQRLAEALVLAPGGRTEAASLVRDGARAASSGGHLALAADLRLLARRARLPFDTPGDGPDDDARDAGAHPPTAPLGLTEREVEVLRLVAAGLTNREIGERLFISPKTASVHVSAILGKLGVDGRLEAALVAQQLGLADADAMRP